MTRKRQQPTAAEIIRRLPLHQQLNASQAMLVKLSPVWQALARQPMLYDCYQNIQLGSFQAGKLVLACNNAVSASQVKHQQQSLLDAFHNKGFKEIKQIIVRIQQPTQNHPDEEFRVDCKPGKKKTDTAIRTNQPSVNSLKAIVNCQKTVESQQLADSLGQLAETLKNFKD